MSRIKINVFARQRHPPRPPTKKPTKTKNKNKKIIKNNNKTFIVYGIQYYLYVQLKMKFTVKQCFNFNLNQNRIIWIDNYLTGNCVRLDGTGDLNHYSCVDRFTSGCPTKPYQDDRIFECKILFSFKLFF